MNAYHDNWLGGLAMHMVGPVWLQLCLNAFVVIVGFLILSGAVNTSIVGSNGVLSRVAEDGVLPDWFLKPHRKYRHTLPGSVPDCRLQLFTILVSRGDVILLGEAYAFGVVWSFVFNTLSMVVLRFKMRQPREFAVPLNFRWGKMSSADWAELVFLIVLCRGLRKLAHQADCHDQRRLIFRPRFCPCSRSQKRCIDTAGGEKHEHKEQFNRGRIDQATADSLGLKRPYRKLVAIRSPHNLFMLEKALADTDPQTTEVIVMTAKMEPPGGPIRPEEIDLDTYDRQLMTAVVDRAEKLGKRVIPLIVPTNNPLNAVLTTAKDIGAQEMMLGASNKFTAEEQLDQIALYWISLNEGEPAG